MLNIFSTSTQGSGDIEDDTSITISPSVVSIPETEVLSTASPFAKKKRTK